MRVILRCHCSTGVIPESIIPGTSGPVCDPVVFGTPAKSQFEAVHALAIFSALRASDTDLGVAKGF